MRPDDTAYPDDAARPVVALPKRRKFARRLKARMSKVAGHKAFLPIMATAGFDLVAAIGKKRLFN